MSYDSLHRYALHAPHASPRLLARVAALVAFGLTLTACADEPTTPARSVHPPANAPLAKNGKPAPNSIAFSLNGPDGQNIFVIDTSGTQLQQITDGGLDDEPVWSPDRRRIAFVRGDGMAREIYVKAMNGGRETAIGLGYQPSWSPDGRQIAFSRYVGNNQDIYVMDADGSNVRRLTTDPAYDAEPHWAPDGLAIAFMSTRTGNAEIFMMKPDGGAQAQRTFCGPSYYCISPKLSPVIGDFRVLFYQGTNAGSTPVISAIKAMDSNGTIVMSVDGALVLGKPAWSPDAQRVAFIGKSADQATRFLYTAEVNGTGIHWFPQTIGSDVGAPAWAR